MMKISKRDALMWYSFFAQLDTDDALEAISVSG